jgi:magnesium chelatase subunit H
MEAGRQTAVAKEILTAKNVPYIVAAPLLIQDLTSWRNQGVQGLQTVVLYALPELDGAIDAVVLGGLVGDKIALVPERVRKLASRLKAWIELRKTPPKERRTSILVYGFPPNVGAVGTAALLNVPKSIERVLKRMERDGYDLGGLDEGAIDGQSILGVLRLIAAEGGTRGVEGCKKLLQQVMRDEQRATFYNITASSLKGAEIDGMDVSIPELTSWLGKSMTISIEKQWGSLDSYVGLGSTREGKLAVVGLRLGKVWVGVQPLLGIEGDPMRLLFDRDLTPHPQYAAFYKWLQNKFSAHAIVHFGMHGTEEWLPGAPLGNTAESWPDILSGHIPNIYLYACNNPSESLLAKRRGYATIVSHNVPPYSRAGLYKDVAQLRELINDYKEDKRNDGISVIPVIVATVERCGLFSDLPYVGVGATEDGILSVDTADMLLNLSKLDIKRGQFLRDFRDYVLKLLTYLSELENRLFSEGLHAVGAPVTTPQVLSYLDALFAEASLSADQQSLSLSPAVLQAIADGASEGLKSSELLLRGARALAGSESLATERQAIVEYSEKTGYGVDWRNLLTLEDQFMFQLRGWDFVKMLGLRVSSAFGSRDAEGQIRSMIGERLGNVARTVENAGVSFQISRAVDVAQLLVQTPTEELNGLMRGLQGEYVQAAAGGDVIRDGAGVLPTGRNIHALDPYRLPSAVAVRRGRKLAEQIVADHKMRTGKYPETVAVTLWGLDTIKTKGESIGIVLGLLGAEPVTEATGRVVGFKLIPLEELKRPRIDVLASLSGIFRDSFGNIVSMLDELFEKAAMADELEQLNHVKKHTEELQQQGIARPASRLFSNPPGDFGSMVNEKVNTGDWEDGSELGSTWERRNAFTFGKGDARGESRPELLKSLLRTTDRIVQEVDSVEYGLTDIQEYYANTGALKNAAESARDGKSVGVSIVEAFGKEAKPRELEEVLRLEYRSKLLNPRWSEAMASQGSGGVYEISQRMTALLGWGGTAGFQEQWVYDGAAERYALDEEMAKKLQRANPEAFQNILRRMLEANGRGWWTPDDDTLQTVQNMYLAAEDDNEFARAQIVPTRVNTTDSLSSNMISV